MTELLSNSLANCENSEEKVSENVSSEKINGVSTNADFKFSDTPHFEDIRVQLNKFVTERNWGKYHSPRNLLLAMVGEVGELAEVFQWRGEVKEGLPDWTEEDKNHLAEELSDVLLYLIRLSEQCRIDLPVAALKKMALNELKYPATKVFGSSKNVQPIKLAYDSYEPVTGADDSLAPVIFLHGMTATKESWVEIPQNVANATKRLTYALDFRNHGASEWSEHFNFDINMGDLIHFLDDHKIQKAVLVGHSMGGVAAIQTALKRPDRVVGIVVEDMFVRKFPKETCTMLLGFMKLLKKAVETAPPGIDEDATKKHIYDFICANFPPQLAEKFKTEPNDAMKNIRHMHMKRDAKTDRYILKANIDIIEKALSDPETIVSEPEGVFAGSALFIYGIHSPMMVNKDEEHIKQFFPNALLKSMDADHSIHIAKVQEFTDSIVNFSSQV